MAPINAVLLTTTAVPFWRSLLMRLGSHLTTTAASNLATKDTVMAYVAV